MEKYQSIPIPTSSPWGHVDGGEEIAPGIVSVYTSSHGGIFVSDERFENMPKALRELGGEGQWYEEDCEWSAVAIAFPDAFPDRIYSDRTVEVMRIARATMARYYPQALSEII